MLKLEKYLTPKTAKIGLLIAIGITVLLGSQLPKLRLSYDFEKFFPQQDEELDFYLDHRKKFETDNDFLLIAIQPKTGIFNPGFLEKLDHLTTDLSKLENVVSSNSISNYKLPLYSPVGWITTSKLDYTDLEGLKNDSIRHNTDPNLKSNLISTDGKAVTILVRNKPYISKVKSDKLLLGIDSLINREKFDEVHIAGKIHGQYHYINKMGQELVFFTLVSLVLLSFFLFFTFRTPWGIWVPILIVGVTIIWLMGFIALIGEELNILCTILPTIIFVVGIADSVHILEKFVHEIRLGHTKLQALIISYKHVGFATLLTALTNSIGFITLLISNIEPIRKFGVFTAVGIMFAFILTYLLLPSALLFLPTPKVARIAREDTIWNKILPRLFTWALKKRKWVIGGTVAICVTSLIFAFNIKINNYLLEDWNDKDPEKMDYVYLEKRFGGVRPVEFAITAKNTDLKITDSLVIKELDKLTQYLETTYQAGAILSPLTLVKTLNRGAHGGDNSYYSLPNSPEEWELIQPLIQRAIKSGQAKAYISEDLKSCRISGRITDYGGFEFKKKNKKLDQFIQANINQDLISIQQTGMPLLIDRNNENLSADIGYELGLSLLMVAALMGLLFRNFRIVVIAIIPNLVPLIIIAGFMGATGIDLKVSTSLIFSIAFGIAVDDTIHFMSNLKLELNQGKSKLYALKATYLSTGKAVTITNLILFSGFFSLVFSSFASTFYLGLLVSLTLFVALIAELTLMPVLFAMIYKKKL